MTRFVPGKLYDCTDAEHKNKRTFQTWPQTKTISTTTIVGPGLYMFLERTDVTDKASCIFLALDGDTVDIAWDYTQNFFVLKEVFKPY